MEEKLRGDNKAVQQHQVHRSADLLVWPVKANTFDWARTSMLSDEKVLQTNISRKNNIINYTNKGSDIYLSSYVRY